MIIKPTPHSGPSNNATTSVEQYSANLQMGRKSVFDISNDMQFALEKLLNTASSAADIKEGAAIFYSTASKKFLLLRMQNNALVVEQRSNLDPQKQLKILFKSQFDALTKKQMEMIVSRLSGQNMLHEFLTTWDDSGTLLPVEITRLIRQKHTAMMKTSQAPAETIKIVEVENLLPEGQTETDITNGFISRDVTVHAVTTQPRQEWLVAALKEDGFSEGGMTLYKNKQTEGTDDALRHPYNVLDVKGDDNRHFQIAVCPIFGNATYIIRKPIDFSEDATFTLATLRKRADVFKISCYSQEQWFRNIRHYSYEDLEKLDEQLKTKIGWSNKKGALSESLRLFYNEHGDFPAYNDTSIIEHGPLTGITTWRRAATALYKGSIEGLGSVKNFGQLKDLIDVKPPVILDTRTIFTAVANHYIQTDNADINDVMIEDHDITDIERSFRSGTVTDKTFLLTASDQKISSLEDFSIATGLISKNGDQITVSPKRLLKILLRTLDPT